MRVIISGGGTGGHIYPGIAIARVLQEQNWEVLFIGTKKGMEADIVPRHGFRFASISSHYIPRRVSPAVLKALGIAAYGVYEAAHLVREFRPDVVVGMGGFVAGPVLLAAVSMRYPTLVHEQNVYPGITNRFLSRFVRQVAVGYGEAVDYLPSHKVKVTGNPVRPEIATCKRAEGWREFDFVPSRQTLLVVPGSQGARRINEAMISAASLLRERRNLQILHSTGKEQFESVAAELKRMGAVVDKARGQCKFGNMLVVPYIHAMPQAYAIADLVVARGGALSAAEITVRGLPAILVPYPHSAEDHQVHNARVLEKHGAAKVLLDHEVTAQSLTSLVFSLLDSPDKLQTMGVASHKLGRPEATTDIVRIIESLSEK